MAASTSPDLHKLVIYSVFVRNHTPEGTFRAVIPDLPRIRSLGADVVWLMPIHPIGKIARKGSLGSPYANRDYRSVNPELGTLDDFRALVDAIHAEGMRCIIDVVYNHTSPDSVLWETHPEWFYLREDGTPGNHVGDWSDIIDLDYHLPASTAEGGLWDYQVQSLVGWAHIVDGFRCDVASFVPVEFWKRARAACEEVRPGCIWLAETVHRSFGDEMRRQSLYCATDSQQFEAFDLEYAYDVQEAFDRFVEAPDAPARVSALSHWLDLVDLQENAYPAGFNKLRFLENHDLPRIAGRIGAGGLDLEALTAMLFFLKGATLLYAGQEAAAEHVPTLFDRDTISWETGRDLSGLISRLAQIKHERMEARDAFGARVSEQGCVVMERIREDARLFGAFPVCGTHDMVEVRAADGSYENLVDGAPVEVRDGSLLCDRPVIISL